MRARDDGDRFHVHLRPGFGTGLGRRGTVALRVHCPNLKPVGPVAGQGPLPCDRSCHCRCRQYRSSRPSRSRPAFAGTGIRRWRDRPGRSSAVPPIRAPPWRRDSCGCPGGCAGVFVMAVTRLIARVAPPTRRENPELILRRRQQVRYRRRRQRGRRGSGGPCALPPCGSRSGNCIPTRPCSSTGCSISASPA